MYFRIIEDHVFYRVRIDKKHWDRVRQYTWHVNQSSNGYLSVYTTIERRPVILSRFILNVVDSNIQVDHINGDTLNNRESNLRVATSKQNNWNRSKKPGYTSRYKGVHWYPNSNKWHADIMCNGIPYRLGYFYDEVDAAKAYNAKATELFGEFARLNDVK